MSRATVVACNGGLSRVEGTFYRAVAVSRLDAVLDGSARAGRYSRPDQPTLYMSASLEGVEAALRKYRSGLGEAQAVCALSVREARVVDLRDGDRCRGIGIEPAEAAADWEDIAAAGGTPPSWRVRALAERAGACGLVDLSRKAPGLWHLVLFAWSGASAAEVRLLGRVW